MRQVEKGGAGGCHLQEPREVEDQAAADEADNNADVGFKVHSPGGNGDEATQDAVKRRDDIRDPTRVYQDGQDAAAAARAGPEGCVDRHS